MNTQSLTNILAFLTLAGDIGLVILVLVWLASYVVSPAKQLLNFVIDFVHGKDGAFAFLVAVLSMSGSLFYSEVAKLTPCLMCWYQRIVMYPLVVIFGVDFFKKKPAIRDHALVLASIGILLSTYQYLLQFGVIKASSCELSGSGVSCAQKLTLNYGYITIPMMTLTAFALIITALLLGKAADHRKAQKG